MGKGKRIKGKRSWKDPDFLSHAQEALTRNFQREIRNSEIWPQMVAKFGEEKAETLLRQCKGEFKPGTMPNEAGHSPEDF